MQPVRRSLVALALLAMPAVALASAAIIETRQANFKAIGRANKAIQDELRKSRPSVAVIRRNAADLDRAARAIPGHFPAGSGPEAGVKTEALPAIWREPQAFAQAADRLAAATRAMQAAAASGDVARIRTAAGGLGPTCKGCHDQFRGKS